MESKSTQEFNYTGPSKENFSIHLNLQNLAKEASQEKLTAFLKSNDITFTNCLV